MEKWQEIVLMIDYNLDFQKHKDEIRKAFRSICEPVINRSIIDFKDDCIYIAGKQYKLVINKSSIGISHVIQGRGVITNLYSINEKMEEAYFDGRENGTYKRLKSINFDYEVILNNLMNSAIEERPSQIREL
ncbi:hypothetical protein [Clostridium culturomicium]|uniref:hypothetical protein n=1 Tax=Clostridium culturomicium TaxID=1499683 RepID=UPI0038575677